LSIICAKTLRSVAVPTEGEGRLVRDLAAHGIATRRRHLGGRDAGLERGARAPAGVVHPERPEDARLGELVERLPADAFDDPAEDVGAEVGIIEELARGLLQLGLEDLLPRFGGCARGLPELAAGR
jgi:hypothetical protein